MISVNCSIVFRSKKLVGASFTAGLALSALTASAGTVTTTSAISITPNQPLLDVYYMGSSAYQDEGNYSYSAESPVAVTKITDVAAAGTPITGTATTSLDVPDIYLNDLVDGYHEEQFYSYGTIVGLYVATTSPLTYGVTLSYNTTDGQQVLSGESDPDFDATWDGTALPTAAGLKDVGLSESDTITALLSGDTNALADLETGLLAPDEPYFIEENLSFDPTVQFLDFSTASDGGSGTITPTVSVPEPTMTGCAAVFAVTLLRRRRI